MAGISRDIRGTVENLVRLTSDSNSTDPLKLNVLQCQLVAKKAADSSYTLNDLEAYQRRHEKSSDGRIAGTGFRAAKELLRVLKDAEILIRECCSEKWKKVVFKRGKLQETFAKIAYEIEWHSLVLYSVLVAQSDIYDKRTCDGKLRSIDHARLILAARQDLDSLRALLQGPHVCDEICKPDFCSECLKDKVLQQWDTEEKELEDRSSLSQIMSSIFSWVQPQFDSKRQQNGKVGVAEVKEIKWLGQMYAMKTFNKDATHEAHFREEVSDMAALDHPNVVRIICCWEDKNYVSILMEPLRKSLHNLLLNYKDGTHAPSAPTPFTILNSVDIMLQIAEGVRYVHSKNFTHLDIMSLNVLVQFADPITSTDVKDSDTVTISSRSTSFTVKLADFGLKRIINEKGRRTSNSVKTAWTAPEAYKLRKGEDSAWFHPRKADVYSFAITCSEILTGDHPFAHFNADYNFDAVKDGDRPRLPGETPRRLAALIHRCWHRNPQLRPDFTAICTELRFIKGLALRGDIKSLHQTDVGNEANFHMETGVKVQGPWGGNGGGQFFDGIVTSIKQITMKYSTDPSPCIFYMEMEYNMNGTSFFIGHGDANHGSNSSTIKIDEPSEYITKVEGSYGSTPMWCGGKQVESLTSLTIHTNVKAHGPFGGKCTSKFKSEYGRVVGFHGRSGLGLDSIGCFTVPIED